MFDFLDDEENAISILKDDHNRLKGLFDEFEGTDSHRQRVRIVAQALEILKLHAAMEEHIFYPAARSCTEDFHMDEADEEHHVAKILIAELESMNRSDDHYGAKFTVLAENVRHHIKEEEKNIFSRVKDADLDLVALGQEMLSLRRRLMQKGVPTSPEERMVATEHPKSPIKSHMARKGKHAKVPAHVKGRASHTSTHTGTTR